MPYRVRIREIGGAVDNPFEVFIVNDKVQLKTLFMQHNMNPRVLSLLTDQQPELHVRNFYSFYVTTIF